MNVILAIDNDTEAPRKERVVEIYKNEVYKDVDLVTYKHVEGNAVPNPESRNAIASDVSEDMDGAVIVRYVEFRDAILRRRLQSVLVERTQDYADDDLNLDDHKYRYRFSLPETFNDNLMEPLAEHIHRFLVWGALYDWYSQFGMPQAGVYGSQLDKLEEDISSILRSPSLAKRPMQPFGPAIKIY
ncbi:MAG: hypothetical protein IKW99_03515 [Bacteroidales bacterium]|nr:hypothetical protein [Bacteroidales bacterium]